jgi:uncharacterized membrane protein
MFNPEPFVSATLAIQIHILCAIPALILGPVALFRKSRDGLHRWAGRVWVLAMAGLALSSFFIQTIRVIGPFSPIHILSVMTIAALGRSFFYLAKGRYEAHGRAMRALYLQALILAGIFTFLPGRRMNEVFFAQNPEMGLPVAAALGSILGLMVFAFPGLSGLPLPAVVASGMKRIKKSLFFAANRS